MGHGPGFLIRRRIEVLLGATFLLCVCGFVLLVVGEFLFGLLALISCGVTTAAMIRSEASGK